MTFTFSWLVPRLLCLLTFCLAIQSCTPPVETEIHLTGQTMGTTYNVKYVPVDGVEPETLQAEMDALLRKINKLMSTYDPESELSRFNAWQSSDPFLVSAQTHVVLQEAIRLGKLSAGVLDVTVGPLVNLWGFGPKARPETVPSPDLIEQVKQSIGLDKLQVQENSVSKATPDLYVDLSTIAKGYGVDQLAELMEKRQIHNYLVEIGGEMRVTGAKADGSQWRIAIEKPVSSERVVQKILSIGDNAIATSGDYRNYFEQGGVRYSHLIDPRTGYPIQHNLVAATVVHASSMTADGLATALMILGKDAALALAEQHNLAVLLITRENDQFKEYTSARFSALVQTVH